MFLLSFLNMEIETLDAGSVAPYSVNLGGVGGVVAPYAEIPYTGGLPDENTSGTCGVRVNMTNVSVVPWSTGFGDTGYYMNPQDVSLSNWGTQAGIGTSDVDTTFRPTSFEGIGDTENLSSIKIPNQSHESASSNASETKVDVSNTGGKSWIKWILGALGIGSLGYVGVGGLDSSYPSSGMDVAGTVSPYGVGLPNLGNLCYINSAMQLLFSIPKFKAAILSHEAGDQIDVDNPDMKALRALQPLFLSMNAKTINSNILRTHYRTLGYKYMQEVWVEFIAEVF
jgi:hypothetical protein